MGLDQVDIKRLRAFYLAAHHGTLRDAANQLNLTISAISLQIKSLESDLNAKLLQRVGHRMRVTAAGALLLPEIENIFRVVDTALRPFATGARVRGRVTIAISRNVVNDFSESIAAFIRKYSDVVVSIQIKTSADILRLVSEGEIDLGLGYFSDVPPHLVKTVIRRTGYTLIASPDKPLLSRRTFDWAAAANHRFIVLRNESNYWIRLSQYLLRRKIKIKDVIEAGSCSTAFMLAKAGIGLAIIHEQCVGAAKCRGLHRLDITEYVGKDDVAVIAPRRPCRYPNRQALMDFLVAAKKAS